ncbi:78 kDa glucose-regulated protein precursor [Elysia marginata]|uniref:78 kDa glucose-regulated protein n=1 Tax=Elysia marginata TaxID=1093978 RepID=A0AAV4HG27_9GAST|nr:78 kDa glucose-regulated protein precursor [Elysia marginata]
MILMRLCWKEVPPKSNSLSKISSVERSQAEASDPDEAVAYNAAVQAGVLSGENLLVGWLNFNVSFQRQGYRRRLGGLKACCHTVIRCTWDNDDILLTKTTLLTMTPLA